MKDIEKVSEYLQASWHTIEPIENGVIVKGLTKSDVVELTSKDIKKIATLLKNDNQKISFGAINILKEFGEKASVYSEEIAKQIGQYGEKEQIEIIEALKKISEHNLLPIFNIIIEQELPYDVLLTLLFRSSAILREQPIEGLEMILKSSKNELMWRMVKEFIQKGMNRPLEEEKQLKLIDLEESLRPAIGISQEAEMKRGQLKGVEQNIIKTITTLRMLEKSGNFAEKKKIKKILRKLRKLK